MRNIISVRGLLLALIVLACSVASAQFRVAVTFGPPALPVYEQPVCPGDGYIWTPGYWAYDDEIDDYYWVPGTWVLAPEPGYLWTPGWWGWGGDAFIFHVGYWGPVVGFYGGINYGFGYFGEGYEGGRWEHGRFFYNRSVNRVDARHVHNVYNTTVIHNTTVNRVSYNGGNGGVNARPTSQQEAAARERHIPPVAAQTQHMQAARGNRQLRASVNQGKPPIAATQRPGTFSGRSVTRAREAGAPYHPPANRGGNAQRGNPQPARTENNNSRPGNVVHPRDLPARERPANPNTGNQKLDQKYQRQQNKLSTKQDQERQKLQQRQEQEHQRLSRQRADETRTRQVEQKHQQQTQQMQQKHSNQQQRLQQKQQPPRQSQPKQNQQPKGNAKHS